MAVPITAALSVEEYLADPAFDHSEYIAGRVEKINVGSKSHGRIQIRCGRKFDEYFDDHSGGYVAAELHCRLQIGGETHFRLPDVAVVLGDPDPEARYLDGAPALVVEIRSPDDSVAQLARRMEEYLAKGAKLGWLVLPEEQSVMIFLPGAPMTTAVSGETLVGGPVLPGFKLPVAELFR